MIVVKRDGREARFDREKIENAIKKAFISVNGGVSESAKQVASDIADYIQAIGEDLDVEGIQDTIEQQLMAMQQYDVAKAFVLYRSDRSRERERKSDFIKTIHEKSQHPTCRIRMRMSMNAHLVADLVP